MASFAAAALSEQLGRPDMDIYLALSRDAELRKATALSITASLPSATTCTGSAEASERPTEQAEPTESHCECPICFEELDPADAAMRCSGDAAGLTIISVRAV